MIAGAGDLTSTITIPELIWTILGLIALIVSSWNLHQTVRDLEALNVSGRNGVLRTIAVGNVREEILRALEGGVITLVGALAMTTPPTVKHGAHVTFLTIVITFALFGLTLLIVGGSMSAARSRGQALRGIRRRATFLHRDESDPPEEEGNA